MKNWMSGIKKQNSQSTKYFMGFFVDTASLTTFGASVKSHDTTHHPLHLFIPLRRYLFTTKTMTDPRRTKEYAVSDATYRYTVVAENYTDALEQGAKLLDIPKSMVKCTLIRRS